MNVLVRQGERDDDAVKRIAVQQRQRGRCARDGRIKVDRIDVGREHLPVRWCDDGVVGQ